MAANFDNIPQELKDQKQWSLWRRETRDGLPAKVPYQPDGKRAKSNKASTWSTFSVVLSAFQDVGGYEGVCFMMPVTPSDIIFIDIDDCIKDGIIAPWALDKIKQFDSYTERSQSCEGLHILIRGKKPIKKCRKNGSPYEIYDSLRPCYLTGDVVDARSTIAKEARQEPLDHLFKEIYSKGEEQSQRKSRPTAGTYPEIADDKLILKARLAKDGAKFTLLWDGSTLGYNGDDSAADIALMNKLAFWTGGNPSQMKRLFLRSGLGKRSKCIDRPDYIDRTIKRAIADAKEFYSPNGDGDKSKEEISEDDLNALPRAENPALKINLEPDNLIMLYMAYGAKTCDAYPEYHYTSSLSLLSICTNRNIVLKMSQDPLYPNVWAMNLGKTTVSRKSAAIGKFQRFADDLFPLSALPQSYSPEGLLEELTENPKGYLVKDEASAMIEAMEKNYMLEMRDIYCILYDCKGYRRKIRTSQRNKQSNYGAKDPFINILCATTPEAFSKHTSLIDLTSGWLLRFIYTFPTYKKPYMHFKPMSEEDQTAYAEVLSRLSYLKGLLYNRVAVIEIELEPEAWAYYQAWQEQRESELVDIGDDIQLAFFGRMAFTALKIAILFTVGRADYTEETTVSLAHIKEACRQADSYFIPIGRIIADFIAMDETNNLQEKILATLGRNGCRLKWTMLMQKTHADKDKLEKAVAALVESEEVSEINVNSKGHKPARWILLNDINKKCSPTFKTIRYTETEDNKDNKDNKNSKSTKDSSNSGDVLGIHGIFAKDAIFDSFAIHGSDVDGSEKETAPTIGPHPRKDAPTPEAKVTCAKCGADLIGHSQVTMNGKLYCAKPGCGYPRRGEEEGRAKA